MRSWWAAALALLVASSCFLFSRTASAEPYQLIARYKLKDKKSDNAFIDVEVASNFMFPRSSNDYAFEGLFLKTNDDELSKQALKKYKRLVVTLQAIPVTCAAGQHCRPNLPARERVIESPFKGPYTLFGAPDLMGDGFIARLAVAIRAEIAADVLCEAELLERAKSATEAKLRPSPALPASAPQPKVVAVKIVGFSPPETDPKKKAEEVKNAERITPDSTILRPVTPGDGKAEQTANRYAFSLLVSHALFSKTGSEPIFASFCKNIDERIDWASVWLQEHDAKPPTDGVIGIDKVNEVRNRHRQWLAARVGLDPSWKCDYDNNTCAVESDHPFAVAKELGAEFEFIEADHTDSRPLATIVDESSDLKFRTRAGTSFCAQAPESCQAFVEGYLRAYVVFEEKADAKASEKRQPVRKEVPFESEDSATWKLKLALRDHLRKTVTLKIFYTDGKHEMELVTRDVQVEDIGVVTTFPIVTEIATALAKGKKGELNPADPGSRSSIPLSWAVNMNRGEFAHGAVTFPWLIGFNTRATPRLSDIIKFYPHISVILPLANEGGQTPATLAYGGGLSLLSMFFFSAAVTIQDTPQGFLLIGLSAQELVDLAKGK